MAFTFGSLVQTVEECFLEGQPYKIKSGTSGVITDAVDPFVTSVRVRFGPVEGLVLETNLVRYPHRALAEHGRSRDFPGYYVCERCESVFESRETYTNHCISFARRRCDNFQRCTRCLLTYHIAEIGTHQCREDPIRRLNRTCFLCHYTAGFRCNLNRHMKNHSKPECQGPQTRYRLWKRVERGEITHLRFLFEALDPELCERVEVRNPKNKNIIADVYMKVDTLRRYFKEGPNSGIVIDPEDYDPPSRPTDEDESEQDGNNDEDESEHDGNNDSPAGRELAVKDADLPSDGAVALHHFEQISLMVKFNEELKDVVEELDVFEYDDDGELEKLAAEFRNRFILKDTKNLAVECTPSTSTGSSAVNSTESAGTSSYRLRSRDISFKLYDNLSESDSD